MHTHTMNEEIIIKLREQDDRLVKIEQSLHKIQNYFMWLTILSFLVVILPLIASIFFIPKLIGSFSSLNINQLAQPLQNSDPNLIK